MKKTLAFIFCVFMMFSLFSCNKGSDTIDNKNHNATTNNTVTDSLSNETKPLAIAEEQAIELASKYWNIKTGDIDEGTGFAYRIRPQFNNDENEKYHRVFLEWLVMEDHYSVVDELWFNKITGEPITRHDKNEEFEILYSDAHYKILQEGISTMHYYIYDSNGKVALYQYTTRPLTISMLNETTVDIRIGMGTGIIQHQYYDVKGNRFSEKFCYVAAASGDLVAYLYGEDLANRKLVVRDIFDQDVFYKEFSLDFAPTVFPIEKAEFSEGEKQLHITYLSETSPTPLETTLQIRPDFNDYPSILQIYKGIVDIFPYDNNDLDYYLEHFNLTCAQDIEWFEKVLSSSYLLYEGRGQETQLDVYRNAAGYAVKDINGDGADELILLRNDYEFIAIFTMVDGKPVLLDNYWYRKRAWIDTNGYIHVAGSGGSDVSSESIYMIANGKLELVFEFGLDGHEWIDEVPVIQCYKIENGNKISITKEEYDLLWKEYYNTPKNVGIVFTSLSGKTAEEILLEYFDAVLENKLMILDVDTQVYQHLMYCRTPYSGKYLWELKDSITVAYIDIDGNGIKEAVLNCGDIIVLRYLSGNSIQAWAFSFRNMYNIKTDGSYSWNDTTADGHEYGEARIRISEAGNYESVIIWRVVNEGEPNAEYYIGEEQVTQEQLQEYINTHTAEKAEFVAFDTSSFEPEAVG